MADRVAKSALYDGLSLVANALGNGRRAEIIDVLTQGERSVEEIAAEIGQSMANTSQHLHKLLRAGLVRNRREGSRVLYAPASDRVGELWSALREVATDHVAQVQQLADAYLGDRAGLETISRERLAQRLRDGDVVVVDVRPTAEYRAGHIAGARSIPFGELERVLRDLPRDADVVAYCRGPFCAFADDAVRLLSSLGYSARRLEDGYPEWRRAGLPVESISDADSDVDRGARE